MRRAPRRRLWGKSRGGAPFVTVPFVTVSDVTREADLNRGTFYAHHDNIEGLLRATMEDITERVSLLMDQSLSADFLDDPMPVLSHIGDYLGSDRALHEKIVSSTSVEPFINSLHEMFRK